MSAPWKRVQRDVHFVVKTEERFSTFRDVREQDAIGINSSFPELAANRVQSASPQRVAENQKLRGGDGSQDRAPQVNYAAV